jgi:hypothetical protein
MFFESYAGGLSDCDPARAVGKDRHTQGHFAEKAGGETDGGGGLIGHIREQKNPGA